MEYNSQRGELRLREYGRHIQNLVNYAITIQNKEEKQDVVYHIIDIMGNINPHLKNVADFNHLLWDHLYIMADFKLDVESPYPAPKKETFLEKPSPFHYPAKNKKNKHYGKNIQKMIEKAKNMDDVEKKEEFATCIANYMKLVHKNWNSENVTDDTILNDLSQMSDNQLVLNEDTVLKKVKSTKSFSDRGSKYRNNRKSKSQSKGRKKMSRSRS